MSQNGYSGKMGYVLLTFLSSISTLFAACAPSDQPTTQQMISADATSAAQPWMSDLFACADELSIVVKIAPDDPQIYLRIGEPETLLVPAYQIDEEELLIVTHRESPVQKLSLEEAQALFSGLGDPSMQVWVYPSELDVQRVFDQFVMQGRSVASSAGIAAGPQQMSDLLNAESNAIGILPKHWKAGNPRGVYSLGVFPVLAVLKEEPQGAVAAVLACLQND